jgi:hypothetical protein
MITCDAVSVSLYRNTGVSLSRHAVTHDFTGALRPRAIPVRPASQQVPGLGEVV